MIARLGVLSFIALFITLNLWGQSIIKGKVVDESGNAIAFATTALLHPQDSSFLTAGETDQNGNFALENDTGQKGRLLIQIIGYDTFISEPLGDSSVDVGALIIQSASVLLDEVVVRSERSMMETQLGKRILYVGKDLANSGGNVLDLLQNIPSLDIGAQGQISIRGADRVLIFINGKERRLDGQQLQQFPASMIQKIEVITNPSAKYDAEGVAGIINIVYHQSSREKNKLQLSGSLGFPARFEGGLLSSLKSGRHLFYLNGTMRKSYAPTRSSSRREMLDPALELLTYEHEVETSNQFPYFGTNGGWQWQIDSTQSLDLDVTYDRWIGRSDSEQQNRFDYRDGAMQEVILNHLDDNIEDEFQLTTTYRNKKSDRNYLDVRLSYGGENEYNKERFEFLKGQNGHSPFDQSLRLSNTNEYQRLSELRVDYSLPVFSFTVLEAGGELNNIDYQVQQQQDFFDPSIQLPLNDFQVRQWKNAVYLVIQQSFGDLEIGLGARMEHFSSRSYQASLDSTFQTGYLSLFPSLQLGYGFKTEELSHFFSFTYSRRINRPGFFDLNPYISYTDPLNLSTGNPFLVPEFAQAFEIGYELDGKNWQFLSTLFLRKTTNTIQSIIIPKEESTLRTLTNFASLKSEGMELRFSYEPFSWLRLNNDFSLFHRSFSALEVEDVIFNRQTSWSIRLEQRIELPQDWMVQVTSYYRSPRIGPQIKYQHQYYVNLGVQKSLWNQRGSLNLSFSDIFNSRINRELIQGAAFRIQRERLWAFRSLRVGLRWDLAGG